MRQLAQALSVMVMEFRENFHWLAMKIKIKISSLIHTLTLVISK
jgi:hypothetical protein